MLKFTFFSSPHLLLLLEKPLTTILRIRTGENPSNIIISYILNLNYIFVKIPNDTLILSVFEQFWDRGRSHLLLQGMKVYVVEMEDGIRILGEKKTLLESITMS